MNLDPVNFLNLGRRSEFLLARLAVAEVAEDQIDRDARALDAGLAAHDLRRGRDPLVHAGALAILIISSLPSSARTLAQSPVRARGEGRFPNFSNFRTAAPNLRCDTDATLLSHRCDT